MARGGNAVALDCLTEAQVMALLGGGLDGAALASVEAHLDVCRLCRLLVSTLAVRTVDRRVPATPRLNAFAPGDVIAERYRVTSLLGVGGMGEVYEALDTVLGEIIAVKTVAVNELLGEWAPSRLKAEVQFARRVTHRNVCRVFDVGFHIDGGGLPPGSAAQASLPFFTMELLRGETLRRHIRSTGALPVERALAILEQMASGLDAAHDAGVVHRDLKSENVMLVPADGEGRVVITDFGLARPAHDWVAGQTATGVATAARQSGNHRTVAGTFGYMAPEQLAGEATGPATDLYAMGIVAFELITGELPFTFSEVVEVEGKSFRALAPALPTRHDVPPRWDAAIRRCLRTAPHERFQRAADLLAALRPPTATAGRSDATPGRGRARSGVRMAVGLAAVGAIASLLATVTAPGGSTPEHPLPPGPPAHVAAAVEARVEPAPVPVLPALTTDVLSSPASPAVTTGKGRPRRLQRRSAIPAAPGARRQSSMSSPGAASASVPPSPVAPSPTVTSPASVTPGVNDLVYPFSPR